ncbi:MAG: hypothetical protein M1820_000458 [Bogoriella megaspora]|nr:MAG: hypothetical protein M1820_000458 [Bogoriella megaspora]
MARSKFQGTSIMLDKVAAVLSNCVTTFSELGRLLIAYRGSADMPFLTRLSWVTKESEINRLTTKLRKDESLLASMLTTLQSNSLDRILIAVDRLGGRIGQISDNSPTPSRQIREAHSIAIQDADSSTPDQESNESSAQHWKSLLDASQAKDSPGTTDFAFEYELLDSRAYSRHMRRDSTESQGTSAQRSASSSAFSGVSLSKMSNTSIVHVPVLPENTTDAHRYEQTSPQDVEPKMFQRSDETNIPSIDRDSQPKMEIYIYQDVTISDGTSPQYKEDLNLNYRIEIFPIPRSSFKSLLDAGDFLKSQVLSRLDIIPDRILETIDEQNHKVDPISQASLDMTIDSLVHRSLAQLLSISLDRQESLIPPEHYDSFLSAMKMRKLKDLSRLSSTFASLIAELPRTDGLLLSYLLDLAATMKKQAEWRITNLGLAVLLQPAILTSGSPREACCEEIDARLDEVEIVAWLIENAVTVIPTKFKTVWFLGGKKFLECGYDEAPWKDTPTDNVDPYTLYSG